MQEIKDLLIRTNQKHILVFLFIYIYIYRRCINTSPFSPFFFSLCMASNISGVFGFQGLPDEPAVVDKLKWGGQGRAS